MDFGIISLTDEGYLMSPEYNNLSNSLRSGPTIVSDRSGVCEGRTNATFFWTWEEEAADAQHQQQQQRQRWSTECFSQRL
ncbi:hypothetical protein ABVT39_009905 [Epinephelus coioides]